MLHLAMFLVFAAASAWSFGLVLTMLLDNHVAIVRALRMQALHGHFPPAPVPSRPRATVTRSATYRRSLRAAA